MSQSILAGLTKYGLLLVPIGVFALAAILSVPLFFQTQRPRRGTIEWIRKHDRRSFAPLMRQELSLSDLMWCFLSVVCGTAASMVYLFLRRGWHLLEDPLGLFGEVNSYLIYKMLFIVLLSAMTYLLVRTLFGEPLIAMSAAILLPFLQVGYQPAAALLMAAFYFFYLWMTADPLTTVLGSCIWLILALLCYGLALVLCFPSVFLLPLFLVGYIYTQIDRWLRGDPNERTGKLIGSLCLTILSLLVWVLLVWTVYQIVSGKLTELSQLRSFAFFTSIFPTFAEQLGQMLCFPPLLDAFSHTDIFLLLAGAASVIPAIYGIVRYRDGRCLMLLLLLVPFGAMWLCGGAYLLSLPFLLLLCWMWKSYAERGRALLAVASPITVLAFAALEIAVWLLQ